MSLDGRFWLIVSSQYVGSVGFRAPPDILEFSEGKEEGPTALERSILLLLLLLAHAILS